MILIRADANEKIGSGHIMRCLSIAHAFVTCGHRVLFVTADHKGDNLINRAGFSSICLNSEYTDLEHEPIVEVFANFHPSLVLVDSYYVTNKYFRSLSTYTKIAYMDDTKEDIWDVDCIINYNIYGAALDYTLYKSTRTKLLLGPLYAPLRPEFQGIFQHPIKHVTDVMVSTGGADPEKITERLINGLCSKLKKVRFHFVIGVLNPRIEVIKTIATDNIVLHIDENNMSGLMRTSDIAISAAGSTLYELCACGTPTITYSLADNQRTATEEFAKQGIMISVGDCRDNQDIIEDIGRNLHRLIDDEKGRKIMSTKMHSLIDGHGAERLSESLLLI